MTDRYDLDHIALAAPDTSAALEFLTGDLGGTILFGGQAIGFRPMQVWLGSADGDGMPVELLEHGCGGPGSIRSTSTSPTRSGRRRS